MPSESLIAVGIGAYLTILVGCLPPAIRLMAKFSEHYSPGIETGEWGGAFKNNRKLKILNGYETVKEGTSQGDTTTNLHNFSSTIFLVPTKTLGNCFLRDPGRNTVNTGPESRRHFSEKFNNHEHWSKLDPYWTSRAENQAI